MDIKKVLYADCSFGTFETLRNALKKNNATLIYGKCKTTHNVVELGSDASIIITETIAINEKVYESCPLLRMVYTNNVGTDLIDIPAATRYGICICNNPDYNFREVAEHTIALLMSLIRKIPAADRHVRDGRYNYNDLSPLKRFEGSTVGLLGFGRIAQLVAKKLCGFDVRVMFYDPYIEESPVDIVLKTSLKRLLQLSDYLCMHAPLTTETYHVLNANTLKLMKPGAAVINTARGELIDTKALITELQSGRLSGAALDVIEEHASLGPTHRLCKMDNVILTPHSGWLSEESFEQSKEDLINEIVRFLQDRPLKALLNHEVLKHPSKK